MRVKLQLTIVFILGLLSLIGFFVIASLIDGGKLARFDSPIIAIVQGWESPKLTWLMKGFTFIGSGNLVLFLSVLAIISFYFILKIDQSKMFLFITAILGSSILNLFLKKMFHRARPELHRLIEIGDHSFPSGHTMNAVTFYGIITFLLWQHIHSIFGRVMILMVSGLLILSIGLSRIYLGVHYPSDIIGAIFASGVWLSIVILVYLRGRGRKFGN